MVERTYLALEWIAGRAKLAGHLQTIACLEKLHRLEPVFAGTFLDIHANAQFSFP